jgi:hypothetical protein
MEVSVEQVKTINLPKIEDQRGNLSFLESSNHIPFQIKRAYWIYDVPGGHERGGHAFRNQNEFIIALSGSFEIIVDDGENRKIYFLNRSYKGVFIPAGLWREMRDFSTNSLALVLSSTFFSENDYIRNYDSYLDFRKK